LIAPTGLPPNYNSMKSILCFARPIVLTLLALTSFMTPALAREVSIPGSGDGAVHVLGGHSTPANSEGRCFGSTG
jgi:hypothetical protein